MLPTIHSPGRNPVALAIERVPALKDLIDPDTFDLPYVFFGSVARLLREQERDQAFTTGIYRLVDELADLNDSNIDDLLITGFFESLLNDCSAEEIARELKSRSSVELLRKATSV